MLERAALIAGEGEITERFLPESLRRTPSFTDECLASAASIETYTRRFIEHHQPDHTEQELAEMLGITRKTLWEKRKKWGLKREGT